MKKAQKAKYTPGPRESAEEVTSIIGRQHRRVAAQGRHTIAKVEGFDAEGSANARLIAAAPDLLEELKALHFDCGVRGCGTCAVIARAEGSGER